MEDNIQELPGVPSLAEFTKHYLIAALWASNDESNEQGGEPLDKNYTVENLAPEAMRQAILDCKAFIEKAGTLLDVCTLEQGGHDFWLTRNHHGAGFWDRGYAENVGKALTDLAHSFGECNPYVGDDGLIYF